MIRVRRSDRRDRTRLAWLDSAHTFSFADYHDPQHVGFGVLRVINEDRVGPGAGFPQHGHRDMEILSYVLDGALEHKDNLGSGSLVQSGDVQRMTAGSGIRHSEYNASRGEVLHFLQIWIEPEEQGLAPSYEQRSVGTREKRNTLRLVASRDGRERSLTVHQDVDVYLTSIAPGRHVRHALTPDRSAWVQVARGTVEVGGIALAAGDGAAICGEEQVDLAATEPADVLLFDLPAVEAQTGGRHQTTHGANGHPQANGGRVSDAPRTVNGRAAKARTASGHRMVNGHRTKNGRAAAGGRIVNGRVAGNGST